MAYSRLFIDVPLPDDAIARVQVLFMHADQHWHGDTDPRMAVASEFVRRLTEFDAESDEDGA
jgi:hypothetical protein